jgi:pullulanase
MILNTLKQTWLRSSRRFVQVALACLLAFSSLFAISGQGIWLDEQTLAAGTHDEVKLTIHYYRYDKNYEGWNLWVWPSGKEGAAYKFTGEDAFGKVATFTVPNMSASDKVGFIVRYSKPGGDEWADREFGDRFITDIKEDGTAEIWVVQGQQQFYYDPADADLSPRVTRAVIDDINKISFETNVAFQANDVQNESFLLVANDQQVAIKAVKALNPDAKGEARQGEITTAEPLDLNLTYSLQRKGFKPADVMMGNVFSSETFESQFTYTGDDLGTSYTPSATQFRLWAPTAKEVSLVLYKTDKAVGQTTAMQKAEQGTWIAKVNGDLNGTFYTYKVSVNGAVNEAVDPYARALSVNGEKGAVIDLRKTDPPNWSDTAKPPFQHATDAIIYELHVRDFSIHPESGMKNKGKFLAFTEENTTGPNGTKTGINHIKDLGVTHVQLLPIYDYATVDERQLNKPQYNWGYDPSNWNAPDGSYATDPFKPEVRIKELKQAIQSLHKNGLRVIMDVVYNHVYNVDSSNLHKIVPGYYFRYKPDGTLSAGTGVGNDTASEHSMMRKLILDSTQFWAKEYKLDGFRFDLMGIHDLKTMKQVRAQLDKIDPSFVIIGEGWNMGTTLDDSLKANQLNAAKLLGIGQFNDKTRDSIKGGVFNDNEPGFVNGALDKADLVKGGIVGGISFDGISSHFAISPEQSVNYVEAHDNLTLWDKLLKTSSSENDETRISMHKLATSIVLTSQGVPFIHAGQEFLRTKDGDHNSYKSPDNVNQMDWTRKHQYQEVSDYYKGLIALRNAHPAFRMKTANEIREHLQFFDTEKGVIGYTLNGEPVGDTWQTIAVIHNANKESKSVTLPVDKKWAVVVDGVAAGTDSIKTFNGQSIDIDGLSTLVLYSGDTSGSAGSPNIWVIIIGVLILTGITYFLVYRRKVQAQ